MNEDIVLKVKERYGAAARGESPGCGSECGSGCGSGCDCGRDCGAQGCCGHASAEDLAKAIGYGDADLAQAGDGNLGLGCGNPLALASIRPGMTVLDLGSGAGFDAFLAADRVGPGGRVIGVDMTPDMLALARKNADARGATNVEFREGRIEALPVDDASVDLVISNCVINLSVDKRAVFREIFRVLKPGGAVSLSDLVLAQPLPDELKNDIEAYVGCIAGASPVGDYLALLFEAGFAEVALPKVVSAAAMTGGATTVLVSATFRATRP